MIKRAIAIAAALAASMATTGTTSADAASSIKPASSIVGCIPWNDKYTAGGWCDGTGPDWEYEVWADCLDTSTGTEHTYLGVERWAGDQRQSYAYCSYWGSGYRLDYAYFFIYKDGVYQYEVSDCFDPGCLDPQA